MKVIISTIMCLFFVMYYDLPSFAELSNLTSNISETDYDFDGNGRLMAIKKPDGIVVHYEYSNEGRLLATYLPENRTDFKYDKNGNCIEARNTTGKTQYFYNPLNQLTKVSYDYPGMKKGISYEYDPWSRLQRKAVISANGAEDVYNTYQYDMYGRLQSADVNGLKINYDYDPSSLVVTRTLQNNIKSIYRYDLDGRLSHLDHYADEKKISSFQYNYNLNGNLTRRIETVGDQTLETSFRYNNAGQITSITYPDGKGLNYKYSAGLLKEIETPAGKMPVNRDTRGLINRIGDTNYLSDNMGRITAVQEPSFQHHYTYDNMDYLKEIKTPKGVMKFDYSAEGLPIRNQWGDQQTFLVPDPMSGVGRSFMHSGSGAYHNVPVPDLSITHSKPHIEINLGDGMGNTCAHLTGKFDRSTPFAQSGLSPSQPPLFKIEKVDIPKVESPFTGIKYGENVQRMIDMGQKLPMPSASRIEAHERYWNSGQYWESDPYYTNTFRDNVPGRNENVEFLHNTFRTWVPGYAIVDDAFRSGVTGLARLQGGIIDSAFGSMDRAFANAGIPVTPTSTIDDHIRNMGIMPNMGDLVWDLGSLVAPQRIQQAMDIRDKVQWSGDAFNLGNFIMDKVVAPITNFIGKGTLWGGANRSGGYFAQDWERDARNRLPTGDPTIPGINKVDGVYRWHDLKDSVNNHAPEGTWVRVRGPNGTEEFYQSKGTKDISHHFDLILDVGRVLLGGTPSYINKVNQRPDTYIEFDDMMNPFPVAKGPGGDIGATIGSAIAGLGEKWQPKGVKLDKPAEFIGQIGAIKGVSFDKESGRLFLIGDTSSKLPPVRLDDFAAAVQVVYSSNPEEQEGPYFSLDPADPMNPRGEYLALVCRPESLAGTHLFDVMFKADWLLKQYAFGVIADENGTILGRRISSVPGYRSHLQLIQENLTSTPEMNTRFWLLPYEMKLEQVGDTLIFTRASMKVESRRMKVVSGHLVDDENQDDRISQYFAGFFTENYDAFAKESPIFEELREAAKVVAIVKWLKKNGVGINDYQIDWRCIERRTDYKRKIPALQYTESTGSAIWYVFGGVELKPNVETQSASPQALSFKRDFGSVLNLKTHSPVAQIGFGNDSQYRIAALPITPASRNLYQDHPVYEQNGIIYAFDKKHRLHTALDAVGGAATFNYDDNDDRLVKIHYATADNWKMTAVPLTDKGREFTIRSPKGDSLQYTLASNEIIKDMRLNGELIAKTTEKKEDDTTEYILEHYRTVKGSPALGDITGKKAKTSKVVCRETVTQSPGNGRYRREGMYGSKQTVEEINFTYKENVLEIQGDCLGKISIEQQQSNTVLVTENGKKIFYECDDTGALKKVLHDNGDFLEIHPDETTLFRIKKGKQSGEITYTQDQLKARDLNGNETIYRFSGNTLHSIDSPKGRMSYKYDRKNQYLQAIELPDGSILKFEWIGYPGTKGGRLRMWKEKGNSQ